MRLLILIPTPADFDRRVHALSVDVSVVHARPGEAAYEEALPVADVMVGRPPVQDVARTSSLQWLQLASAGANNYVGRIPKTIRLTAANGVYGIPVSEHAFALMLGLARSVPAYIRQQTARRWEPHGTFLELSGSTCGVLGLGDIGMAVASRAAAFGMRVVGMRRNPHEKPDGIDEIFGPDELGRMLSECDFVVNTLPGTSSTEDLLDGKMLRSIRKGGVLINVGRGNTIDETALVEVLEDGHLSGAGLDVFEEEPLPESSPLWRMPNVIITPHIGGESPRGDDRVVELFLDNLRRFLDGGSLQNEVDHDLGY